MPLLRSNIPSENYIFSHVPSAEKKYILRWLSRKSEGTLSLHFANHIRPFFHSPFLTCSEKKPSNRAFHWLDSNKCNSIASFCAELYKLIGQKDLLRDTITLFLKALECLWVSFVPSKWLFYDFFFQKKKAWWEYERTLNFLPLHCI